MISKAIGFRGTLFSDTPISLHIVVITGDLERDLKDVFAILRTGDHSEGGICARYMYQWAYHFMYLVLSYGAVWRAATAVPCRAQVCLFTVSFRWQAWGTHWFFTNDMAKSKSDDWQPDMEWISLASQVDGVAEVVDSSLPSIAAHCTCRHNQTHVYGIITYLHCKYYIYICIYIYIY